MARDARYRAVMYDETARGWSRFEPAALPQASPGPITSEGTYRTQMGTNSKR